MCANTKQAKKTKSRPEIRIFIERKTEINQVRKEICKNIGSCRTKLISETSEENKGTRVMKIKLSGSKQKITKMNDS